MNARSGWRAALAIFMIAMAAVSTRIADPFDLNLLDRQFTWLRANFPQPSAHEVVIVGMDQQTTEILREPLAL